MANRNLGLARAPLGDRAPCVQSSTKKWGPQDLGHPPQPPPHRDSITATKIVGGSLDMSIWCPETILRGIKPRAPLEQLPPAVFRFQKIGPGPKTSIFLRKSEVSIRRQPAGNPAATRRHRPGKDNSALVGDLHNKNPSLVALGKKGLGASGDLWPTGLWHGLLALCGPYCMKHHCAAL